MAGSSSARTMARRIACDNDFQRRAGFPARHAKTSCKAFDKLQLLGQSIGCEDPCLLNFVPIDLGVKPIRFICHLLDFKHLFGTQPFDVAVDHGHVNLAIVSLM